MDCRTLLSSSRDEEEAPSHRLCPATSQQVTNGSPTAVSAATPGSSNKACSSLSGSTSSLGRKKKRGDPSWRDLLESMVSHVHSRRKVWSSASSSSTSRSPLDAAVANNNNNNNSSVDESTTTSVESPSLTVSSVDSPLTSSPLSTLPPTGAGRGAGLSSARRRCKSGDVGRHQQHQRAGGGRSSSSSSSSRKTSFASMENLRTNQQQRPKYSRVKTHIQIKHCPSAGLRQMFFLNIRFSMPPCLGSVYMS